MQFTSRFLICLLIYITVFACKPNKKAEIPKPESRTKIEISTDFGNVTLELYNETPKHRDNFIKLAEEGILDSLLFHRVIEDFMIQGGDPESKYAQPGDTLGNGGLDYRIDAEFVPELFHKKGVLAAARDNNPERASSSTQFYLVQGKLQTDSTLALAEERINTWIAQNIARNDIANRNLVNQQDSALEEQNWALYNQLNDSLKLLGELSDHFSWYFIPDNQREVYKTIGGTPHLDHNYTVFGEIIDGLSVVDSIASVKTGQFDRPVKDVRIISVKVLH